MADMVQEYAARAATYRRLAGELKNDDDRAALLAIAVEYEAEAERLSRAGRGPGRSRRPAVRDRGRS